MSTIKTVSKSVIQRDWLEIEPKLLAVAGGLTAGTLVTLAATLFHYKLDPTLAVAVSGLISLLIGYAKHSTATFPVGAVEGAAAQVVEAAVPAVAPQVEAVQSVLAPAFAPAVAPVEAGQEIPVSNGGTV